MRFTILLLAGSALAAACPAFAADELKFGKPPAWVVPQAIPAPSALADAPVALLLTDQQIRMEPGKVVTFAELAMKIQKPEGLSAGNISIPWNPATDTITVNKLEIHRGNQVIDVLAAGQKFTTLRREQGLEEAMLDGVLTANIQPEGLQEGDIVNVATTTEHADPVFGNHVEANFAEWPALPIRRAHVRIDWPSSLKMNLRAKGVIAKPVTHGGLTTIEISGDNVQPIVAPKGAPPRFTITRLGETADFASWADVASLMQPLFRKAEAIPVAGPLHDEVEKIRGATSDPKLRAEKALQLVQDRVRYVALDVGQGGYVPADAETTWSRRFGDCKAKTALLLGLLHSLGIEAEPLLAQSRMGDAIAERLPMLSYFDHVLVRAHIDGKTYYLDGTRTGETDLDRIDVPDFGWALPVVDKAELVDLIPPPLSRPQSDTTVAIDASAGIYSRADVNVVQVIRGDLAIAFNSGLASLSETQRKEFFDNYWKKTVDDITPADSSVAFDKAARELRLSMRGKLKLDWSGGFFHLPLSSIGYTPDVDRPEGPLHDAPFAVAHPVFARTEVKLRMPAGFFPASVAKLVPEPVHQTLIGVEYSRVQTATPDGMTVETTTRSLVPEVSYKDAVAGSSALKNLAYGDVSVRLPAAYRPTAADVTALSGDRPSSKEEYIRRGSTYLDARKFDDAIADFAQAIASDPKNSMALAGRGLAYAWKRDFASAEKDLAAAEAVDASNAVVLRARGFVAQQKDDCATAIELFTRSLAEDARNAFALGRRATCEAALLKFDAALADAAEALKVDPTWTDLRIMRANILMRQGKRDLVALEAEALVRDNPQSDYALVGAAKTYAALGRTQEALNAFDKALELKPLAYIYLNREQVRPRSDIRGRLDDLDAGLKLDPHDPDVLAEKARLLSATGDYKGALAILDQVKPDPDNQFATMERAIVLQKAGRTAEAQKLFAEARARARTASELNTLCWTKATADVMLDSALQDCRDALKLDPDNPAYIDSLGMVLLKLGKLDQALDAYDKAVAKGSGAASLMGRAFVYLRKGDGTHAEADAAAARKQASSIDDVFADYGLKFDARSAAHNTAAQSVSRH